MKIAVSRAAAIATLSTLLAGVAMPGNAASAPKLVKPKALAATDVQFLKDIEPMANPATGEPSFRLQLEQSLSAEQIRTVKAIASRQSTAMCTNLYALRKGYLKGFDSVRLGGKNARILIPSLSAINRQLDMNFKAAKIQKWQIMGGGTEPFFPNDGGDIYYDSGGLVVFTMSQISEVLLLLNNNPSAIRDIGRLDMKRSLDNVMSTYRCKK